MLQEIAKASEKLLGAMKMTGKEKLLSKRILATLLAGAVLGVCNLMPVHAANSGGTWSGESWTKDDEYIGDKSPTGSTVVIAEDNSGKEFMVVKIIGQLLQIIQ